MRTDDLRDTLRASAAKQPSLSPDARAKVAARVRRQRWRLAVTAALAISMAAIGVGGLTALATRDDARAPADRPTVSEIPFETVPEGVSTRLVSGVPVFLVRDGDQVTTFIEHTQHLDTTLWFCPNEDLFVGPAHGEMFNRDGYIVSGPAAAGLDEFETAVENGMVLIDTQAVVQGPRERRDAEIPPGREPWNTTPDSFCHGAVGPPDASASGRLIASGEPGDEWSLRAEPTELGRCTQFEAGGAQDTVCELDIDARGSLQSLSYESAGNGPHRYVWGGVRPGAPGVTVRLSDGRELRAPFVGYDDGTTYWVAGLSDGAEVDGARVSPLSKCPTSAPREVVAGFAAVGLGPVYATYFSQGAVARYDPTVVNDGWFSVKVLWLGTPDLETIVRARGYRLDGMGDLRFGTGTALQRKLTLDPDHDVTSTLDSSGWLDWPSQVRVRAPGCYVIQVTGAGIREEVILRIEPR